MVPLNIVRRLRAENLSRRPIQKIKIGVKLVLWFCVFKAIYLYLDAMSECLSFFLNIFNFCLFSVVYGKLRHTSI